jgi:hypothetical protein
MRMLTAAFAAMSLACSDSTAPRVPRTIEMVGGDGQSSWPGEEIPLKVRVIGSDNRPFAGAPVQWRVIAGAATVGPAQSTTNSNGEADTRVTLGAGFLRVDVTATVQGMAPVTFALFPRDPCQYMWPEITLDSTINGMLSPFDCTDRRWVLDFYTFWLDSESAIEVIMRAPSFNPELQLHSEAPWYVYWWGPRDEELRAKAILPEGFYVLAATSTDSAATGPYELRVRSSSPSAENCEEVLVMIGLVTTQSLTATDCRESSGENADRFFIFLFEGQRVRITQHASRFSPLLSIHRGERLLAESQEPGSGTAVLIYSGEANESGDLYEIRASSAGAQGAGVYTLRIAVDIAASSQSSRPPNEQLSFPELGRPRAGYRVSAGASRLYRIR